MPVEPFHELVIDEVTEHYFSALQFVIQGWQLKELGGR